MRKAISFGPLVSIVVPVFNVKSYVLRCLSSIERQTYPNIQIIVIDDGSTDGSGALCDEWARSHSNAMVVHTVNSGLSAARNRGMCYVKGDYVAFLDSDDAFGPHHIENLIAAIENTPDPKASVAVTGFTAYSENMVPGYPRGAVSITNVSTAEAISKSVTVGEDFAAHAWGKLYPRTLFGLLHYPVGRYYEDQFVTYKVFLAAKYIAYEDAKDYLYSVDRPGSISASSRVRELDYLDAIRETLECVKIECPSAVPAVRDRYLNSLICGVETACLFGDKQSYRKLFDEANSVSRHIIKSSKLNDSMKMRFCLLALGSNIYHKIFKAKESIRRLSPNSLKKRLKDHRIFKSENRRVTAYYRKLRTQLDGSCAFLLMTPRYRNYGDHLIAYSERMLLADAGISGVLEIPYEDCQVLGPSFREIVRPKDFIFFTGGGYLGDLWPGLENTAEKMLGSLGEGNRVFFFPESIYYANDGKASLGEEIAASKAQIIVAAREAASFNKLVKLINPESVRLFPDVGLFVRRSDLLHDVPVRLGHHALICLRKDKEGLLKAEFGVELTAILESFGFSISAIDTHNPVGEVGADNRRSELGSLARRFGEASLVITDRLHGMVLAMMMGTPCVAFDNISHKVSGVAQWIASSGYPLVICTEEGVSDAVKQALTMPPYKGDISDVLSAEKKSLVELLKKVAAND